MQSLLENSLDKNKTHLFKKKLSISDIEKFYLNSMTCELKIGLEYERLSLDKNTLKTADYERVEKIIEHFASIQKWELIYDNKTVIGAKDNSGTSISLEPGCQFELSLAPKNNIEIIDIEASRIIGLLDKIADIYDIKFLGYGITPNTNVDEITILNKRRYKIMNDYLPNCYKGELCPKMMRQTAGIQINIDYKDKDDAYNKIYLFNILMPFITGLYSNSPIEDNKIKEYKSIRNNVWRFTGEDRCNLFYREIFNKKFFKHKNVFKNYINEILDTPMVFIEREDEYIPIKGKITFREFMKSGYMKYRATINDYLTHQSLCFPDVRLKNCIEIRNHDSNSLEYALALCALYKGICLTDTEKALKEFKFIDIEETDKYFKNSAICGLDFKIGKIEAWEVAAKILNLAIKNLNEKEKSYLAPIKKLIAQKKTPADIIIECGVENARELVKFL